MNEIQTELDDRQGRSIERMRSVSKALSDASRRARFSSRSKQAFSGAQGLRRRARERIIRLVLLVLVVVLPNIASIGYFGFIASDQYESIAKFTVSSGALPKMDDLGSATGLPPMAIVQDTMIVVSYAESQALVAKLQDAIDLRKYYSSDKIDYFSRFNAALPIEKFTNYWTRRSSAAVSMPSGIVTLRVRAFSAADAKTIATAVVQQCEAMINQLNERMFKDTVAASERDLQLAGEALKSTRVAYEKARNAEGVFDVKEESKNLGTLLTQLEGQLLTMQSEYATRSAYVAADAPQMRLAAQRIASLKEQVKGVQNRITSMQQQGDNGALSQKLSRFANLDLEQKIAEKRYAQASISLNMARIYSERKMLYLHTVEMPAEAEEPRYPRRVLTIGLVLLGSILAWFISIGLVGLIRRRLA
ncbi:lipopolysaccharide biosynthesis protein [Labrys okinawensis]|uniref:Lipopolysaccharide biosynthesis protein n=1 Tax=Labrys okinawensis TaxID=346911 RepID=A0A2S9Q3I3_9HYPH|nr:lipopolysaccharide biosynthesis protein [Labrys okinawensis]PRH83918.1 lipopolysaccharide biosynthesis protein [Labrys okinawensis]